MKPHCCKNFTHDFQAKSGKSYQTFSLDSGNFWWVCAVNLGSGSLPVYLDNDRLPAHRRHQQGCWALRRQLRVQVMNAISPLCVSSYECFWLYCWLQWKTGFTENHGWNSGDSRSFCSFVILKQLFTYAQVYRANPSSTLLAKKHLSYTAPQHYKQPVMICGHLCNHQYLILPNTYYARHRLNNISISTITFSLPSKKNASVCTPGIKMFLNFSWQLLTEQQACGKAAHSAFLRGRFCVVEVQRPHFTSSQLKDSGVWQSLLYCYVLICEQSGGLRCVCHPSP